MLLPHAVLILGNSTGQFIAIPVANFPLLPIGSNVSVYISEKVWFEGVPITKYTTTNRLGTEIDVDLRGPHGDLTNDEALDSLWARIAEVCIRDLTEHVDWLFPHVIAFDIKYPVPSA